MITRLKSLAFTDRVAVTSALLMTRHDVDIKHRMYTDEINEMQDVDPTAASGAHTITYGGMINQLCKVRNREENIVNNEQKESADRFK